MSKKKKTDGVYNATCDASVKGDEAILSVVIVSPNDKLVYQSTIKQTVSSITRAELMAIKMLLENAKRLNVTKIRITSDSKTVVDMVQYTQREFKQSPESEKLNAILFKTRELIDSFEKVELTFKKREFNVYADSLCRLRREESPIRKKGGAVNLKRPYGVTQ